MIDSEEHRQVREMIPESGWSRPDTSILDPHFHLHSRPRGTLAPWVPTIASLSEESSGKAALFTLDTTTLVWG